ncbi:MAG: PEP-CTERM sorting domain-containing protein [Cyanobacteria bacterium SBLK]|nr:PEP-CTERM sorting domain-containing protein [Cyanobacteria bacterium SBLK]
MNRFFTTTTVILGLATGVAIAEDAFAFTITDTVSADRNLYHDDWGHPYTVPNGGNELFALGRGSAPIAFGNGFAFSSGQQLDIAAQGCVIVGPVTNCPDPDGQPPTIFRELTVLSLIGVWSSDANTINAINDPFFVGSSLDLVVPDYTDSLYLFLGINDGSFAENPSSSFHTVTISGEDPEVVPEPSAILGILAFGVFGTCLSRKRAA